MIQSAVSIYMGTILLNRQKFWNKMDCRKDSTDFITKICFKSEFILDTMFAFNCGTLRRTHNLKCTNILLVICPISKVKVQFKNIGQEKIKLKHSISTNWPTLKISKCLSSCIIGNFSLIFTLWIEGFVTSND